MNHRKACEVSPFTLMADGETEARRGAVMWLHCLPSVCSQERAESWLQARLGPSWLCHFPAVRPGSNLSLLISEPPLAPVARCGAGHRVAGKSPAGGAVTGPLRQGPGGRTRTKWVETPGRQDGFLQPHLLGIVSHMSLRVTCRTGRKSPMGNLGRTLFKQRSAWGCGFPPAGPCSIHSPGDPFSPLSLGEAA